MTEDDELVQYLNDDSYHWLGAARAEAINSPLRHVYEQRSNMLRAAAATILEAQELRSQLNEAVKQHIDTLCYQVFNTQEDISTWMNSANSFLDHETPNNLIANGEGGRVVALLTAIAEGAFL